MADSASTGSPPEGPEPGSTTVGAGSGSAGGSPGGSGGVGSSVPPSHESIASVGAAGHTRFAGDELAIVLSHYDIGVLEKIQPFPRGSRRAPKLKLKTDHGNYLLKRRARAKTDPYKVAFAHELQLHLADHQFPLPHLIGTKYHNNSMLKWQEGIYELFEYISGTGYDNSLEATGDAGRVLALFHKLLRNFEPTHKPASGSYHNANSVFQALQTAPQTLRQRDAEHGQNQASDIDAIVQFLSHSYQQAAQTVEALEFSQWPVQIIHSDWHPGNMLFRGPQVVAVIDYDAARYQPPVVDMANGALQFSIVGGGEDPSQWPEYVDEARFKRFLRSYDQMPDCVISRAELEAIPWLMIEALVAESIIPVAATGAFARLNGGVFLSMVSRKVRWIRDNAEHLMHLVEA
jgi:homoserine kinase type II